MMAVDDKLDRHELEAALRFVLAKAKSQGDAQRAALAVGLSITVETHGAPVAVEFFRDIADDIEARHLPRGGRMQ